MPGGREETPLSQCPGAWDPRVPVASCLPAQLGDQDISGTGVREGSRGRDTPLSYCLARVLRHSLLCLSLCLSIHLLLHLPCAVSLPLW